MATSHITFNDQLSHGRDVARALQQLQEGRQGLIDVVAVLQLMIDGDSSDASQFTQMATNLGMVTNGTPENATAKAAWEELVALKAKVTDDTQTSVSAAMLQAFAKFG
jgi:hypothetical protein